MKLKLAILLSLVVPLIGCNKSSNIIDVASFVDITGQHDCSDKIQELIINNPHRTLYFRDGTYLLDRQILTPGDPTKSVDLQLSNYAILKASDKYQVKRTGDYDHTYQDEYLYMVCLGGLDRKNDVITPGSVYSLTGGIIDGSGKAAGVEIAGGRETRVQNVSMKGVQVGLRIAKGVNGGGSSDADIRDISIICNDDKDSYGLILQGSDNTASNIRIGHATHGVYTYGGTNFLSYIHPLHNSPGKETNYDQSIGFEISNFTILNSCYSDNFRVAYQLNNTSAFLTDCVAWWFGPAGVQGDQYAINSVHNDFNATINNFAIGVKEITDTIPKINPEIMVGVANGGGDGTIHNIRARNRDLIKDITHKDDAKPYTPTAESILKDYLGEGESIGLYQ